MTPRRPLSLLLLVAVLMLGGAAHLWHHVADADCDEGHGPTAHPCVACAALHGAAVTAHAVSTDPPATLRPSAPALPALAAPLLATPFALAPRAPPRG